jgi:hypothetical protein
MSPDKMHSTLFIAAMEARKFVECAETFHKHLDSPEFVHDTIFASEMRGSKEGHRLSRSYQDLIEALSTLYSVT